MVFRTTLSGITPEEEKQAHLYDVMAATNNQRMQGVTNADALDAVKFVYDFMCDTHNYKSNQKTHNLFCGKGSHGV